MTRSNISLAVFAASLATVPASAHPQRQATGSVSGVVTVAKDGRRMADRSNVVISIYVPGADPRPQRARVRQKNRTFAPDLTVVTTGSVVDFPNDDKIFHNVFSLSRAARFDLGLYKSGTTRSVEMRREGVVNVYCNIHPEMASKIKVVDTPFYATTGRDGRFKIDGIPPGRYPMNAWVPYGTGFSGEIVVRAGENTRADVVVLRDNRPRRHLRKDGTPYGRYQ